MRLRRDKLRDAATLSQVENLDLRAAGIESVEDTSAIACLAAESAATRSRRAKRESELARRACDNFRDSTSSIVISLSSAKFSFSPSFTVNRTFAIRFCSFKKSHPNV